MSLIENALKKLQGKQPAEQRPVAKVPRATSAAVPNALRQKLPADGPKHHVSRQKLIDAGLLAALDEPGPAAEEFRRIKRPLISNATNEVPGDEKVNLIMISSALPNAGKTFCSVNLAVSISMEREVGVLLVDADVAKREVSRQFGLESAPGLIDLLLDESLHVKDLLVQTDLHDIQVLPAGRTHPRATELLASGRMSSIVRDLAVQQADCIVILDSPPLLITSEAQAVASHVGQITLVVEAGRTSQHELSQVLETLDESKIVNIILNKARRWGGGDYLGEYGSYGYGSN